MKIGIDVRLFAAGKRTGVEEYARNFLKTLFEKGAEHEFILFFNSYKGVNIDFSWATSYKNVTLKKFSIPNKLLNLSLWYFKYPKLDKLLGGVDIFFMPNINFTSISKDVKLFLTIHDLSFEHYKQTFSLKRQLWHWLVNPRLLSKKAYKILAVSQATRRDLEYTYKISNKKILVTLNGKTDVSGKLNRNSVEVVRVKEKYSLPYKFILSFGTIEPRKNIIHTIRGFEFFKNNSNLANDYKLVIAGASGWKEDTIENEISKSKYRDDIIRINDIPSEDKEALFVLSEVFVYASFYEGFGFPPLEALITNTPTITSNTSSLPEVVGENGILIDPYRPEEIGISIKNVIENKDLKKGLSEIDKTHFDKFSWEKSVEIFLNEINKI